MSGFDRGQLKVLFLTYYRLAARGRAGRVLSRRGSGRSGMIMLFLLYTFLGFVFGAGALNHPDLFTFALVIHTVTFVLTGMFIVTEAGDVLFNLAEEDVLGFLPIPPRTRLLAKAMTFVASTLLLSLALNLGALFFGHATHGAHPWFAAAHLFAVLTGAAFSTGLVVAVYALVTRFVDRDRFDAAASWAQAGMAIVFVLASQLAPRLVHRSMGLHFERSFGALAFLPPTWFAAIDVALAGDSPGRMAWILAGVGCVVTVLVGYLGVARLAAGYTLGLTRLKETPARPRRSFGKRDSRSSGERDTRSSGKGDSSSRGMSRILRLWLKDPAEMELFRLAATFLRRDRELRIRLYPSLAMFVLLPLIGLFDRDRGGSAIVLVMMVWMLGLVPTLVLDLFRFSSQFAAAEIFLSAPLPSAAPLFHGVRKAATVFVLLPLAILTVASYLLLVPEPWIMLALSIPAIIALPSLSMIYALFGSYVPLSEPPEQGSQARRMVLVLGLMVLAGILYGLSFLAYRSGYIWFFIALEFVVLIALHPLLLRAIKRRPIPRLG